MADVGKLTQRLSQSAATDDRRAAASQLRNAGFARRHSLEKRGTLGTAAHSHLAEHELAALHAALEDDDPHVVRDAIIAAGDLGDASSVPALLKHLDTDDEEVTLAAIDSLGDIGGLESVEALTQVACDNDADDHARLAALTELEELAAKRITSGPDRRFDPEDSAAGGTRPEEPKEVIEAKEGLAQACDTIAEDSDADDFLRLKASDVRAYLASGVA